MSQTLKRLRTIALMVVFLLCMGHTKVSAQTEEKKDAPLPTMTGIIISTCMTLEAINRLAALDKQSQESATQLFTYYIATGKCGRLGQPTMVFLDKLIEKYNDSNGESVEVWSLFGMEHWALVRSDLVMDKSDRKKNNGLTI